MVKTTRKYSGNMAHAFDKNGQIITMTLLGGIAQLLFIMLVAHWNLKNCKIKTSCNDKCIYSIIQNKVHLKLPKVHL